MFLKMKVNQFLKNSKSIYNELMVKHRIVIGNQSADLDSIASSISAAYYLSKTSHSKYIPIINSTESILKSKKECMYMLECLSIGLEDLVFISDWKKNQVSEIVLVDHNELDVKEKDLDFSNLVTGIIDHHLDKEGFKSASPRIIDTSAGSCATLVSELFLKSNVELDESFASMMLFPILSDTDNLTMRASKKDCEMVEFLKRSSTLNPVDLYQKIVQLKYETDLNEDMSTLLKKDYKQYENDGNYWGLSSVAFSAKKMIEENNFFDDIGKFIAENGLYFYGILSCFKQDSNDFKKDLVLFGSEEFLRYLKSSLDMSNLDFIKESYNQDLSFILYDIIDLKLTRKYWHPNLEKILKSYKK